ELPVRTRRDSFRFFSDFYGGDDLALRDVHDACRRNILIGAVQQASVFAQIKLLRIRPALDDLEKLVLYDVEHPDAVSTLVRRGQFTLIDIGPANRRAAESHVDRFAIGTGVNSSRALPKRNGRDYRLRGGIDHAEVA